MTAAKHEILQGWKDIAAYVSRDVRTVRRWEKQRGLPVRRMPGDGRANVYALVEELDGWLLAGVGSKPEPFGEVEASVVGDGLEAADVETPSSAMQSSAIETQPGATDTRPGATISASGLLAEAEHFIEVTPARYRAIVRMLTWRRRWVVSSAAVVCLGACAAVAVGVRTSWLDRAMGVAGMASDPSVRSTHSSTVKGVEELYLQGIYFYEQRTPETLERALKCFRDAIALDGSYAPAYAGLAQAYNLVRQYSMMPEAEAYAQAETSAEKAIALDPTLPDAHASLGFVKFFWERDPVIAEKEFRTAIALDPTSSLAHHWYGSMLTHQGRFSESLAELELAQRLEPTSTSILGDKAFALALGGHPVEARAMLQEVLNEDQKSPAPHHIMSVISLLEPRDVPRYLDELRRFANLRHDTRLLGSLDPLETAFQAGGANAVWRAMLAEEERDHPSPGERNLAMARAEGLLGMNDACLRDLEQLAERRDPALIGVHVEPAFAGLHGDPRFLAIAERVGLNGSR